MEVLSFQASIFIRVLRLVLGLINTSQFLMPKKDQSRPPESVLRRN